MKHLVQQSSLLLLWLCLGIIVLLITAVVTCLVLLATKQPMEVVLVILTLGLLGCLITRHWPQWWSAVDLKSAPKSGGIFQFIVTFILFELIQSITGFYYSIFDEGLSITFIYVIGIWLVAELLSKIVIDFAFGKSVP